MSSTKCPQCAEKVKLAAKICKHCGSSLPDKTDEINKTAKRHGRIYLLLVFLIFVVFLIASESGRGGSSSRYHGSCIKFNDGTTTGCAAGEYCLLKTERNEGGVQYFEGVCTNS